MNSVCWFMFLAEPLPDSPEFADTGGAFINAWVAHPDEAIAEQIARAAIADELWSVERIEEQGEVSRSEYADAPDQLEYFEQALVVGHCLLFHTWPPGEDADD